MSVCQNCLHSDVCRLHEDNFMADAAKNVFCGKFKNKENYIDIPCKIDDIVFDKEGNRLKVISIEKFSNEKIALHCISLSSTLKQTLFIGRTKKSIGKTVFFDIESYLERKK